MPAFPFTNLECSLVDLLGEPYVEAACRARAALTGRSLDTLMTRAHARIAFLPPADYERQCDLLAHVGERLISPLSVSTGGAPSAKFEAAFAAGSAPLSAWGWFRLGEDGHLRLITKSEHYHVPLGHGFPGFELLDVAREAGIPNATHNNTRGYITRRLEEALVAVANGLDLDDDKAISRIIADASPHTLNRVLNLQSGSLAAEAALKLALARFYCSMPDSPAPPQQGKTPVFIVVADDDGGPTGNYHGTAVFAQMLRGMWPGMYQRCAEAGIFRFRAVKPNDLEDLRSAFAESAEGECRPAAFVHEIVMMNYGGRLLSRDFLQTAYDLARRHDAVTIVDEIQSCLWSPSVFMFREYDLAPDAVVIGKGMSGGEYAASRLIFSSHLDCLPQFGALVTNGQEELASLAYLVSLRWVRANAEQIRRLGDDVEHQVRGLREEFPRILRAVEGSRHLLALVFEDTAQAQAFATTVSARGLDISVQTYKANCPPAALLKPPITLGKAGFEAIVNCLRDCLRAL